MACCIQESPAEHQKSNARATGDVPVPPEEPVAGAPWNNLTPSASIPRSWGHPASLPGTQQPTGPAHQRNTRPRPRPPAGQARKHGAYWQTVERVQQYRERRAHHRPRPTARTRTGQPGPGAAPPLPGLPPAARPAPATAARLRAGAAPQAHSRAQGPGQGGTIGPRQAVVPNGEQENKGIRAAAGGSPSAESSERCNYASAGEVSKDAPKNQGPLTVPSASSQGTHPRDPARSRRPVPAEGMQGSVAGLAVAAVASSPLVTGAAGRCLLHITFGISTVRESQMQPPIDRSRQAG